MSEKITNEQVLGRIGEKRTLLNNILRRKKNTFQPSTIPAGDVKFLTKDLKELT